jgi:hypothetical protein
MKTLDIDFSKTLSYDQSTMSKLADYFDINIATDNLEKQTQWFHNLSILAQQNLGLSLCLIHHHVALGAIDIINQHLGVSTSDSPYKIRPYAEHVGAFSFFKIKDIKQQHIRDSIRLIGRRLTGVKLLASGLKNADYYILRVFDESNKKRWVFLDLTKIEYKIESHYDNTVGMRIAEPYDLNIDAELPAEWILDNYIPSEKLTRALGFYNYGQITNYWAASNALLELIKSRAKQKYLNIDYELLKFENQIDMLKILWEKNITSIFEPMKNNKNFWRVRHAQYSFGKRTLIDVINFFMQLAGSSSMQMNENSQMFRDCLIYSSHPVDLYSQLKYPELLEDLQST